jgi:hypothetical protein
MRNIISSDPNKHFGYHLCRFADLLRDRWFCLGISALAWPCLSILTISSSLAHILEFRVWLGGPRGFLDCSIYHFLASLSLLFFPLVCASYELFAIFFDFCFRFLQLLHRQPDF